MKIIIKILLFTFLLFGIQAYAQFNIGVNKNEATAMMRLSYYPFITEKEGDSLMNAELPNYKIIKTVDSVAMDNAWSVIKFEDKGIVSFRGTTTKSLSWLENFYSAMIPAKGVMTLPSGKIANYTFSEDERAGIQTGWSLAIIMVSPVIIDKIKRLNHEGIFNIYITGHSQGGALALLFRAFLEHIPESILSSKNSYKTYAFAAPKPGNRFFSYDYNKFSNKNLSSHTFLNPFDWVPLTPFTVQSPNNTVEANPFTQFEKSKDGSLVKRIALHQMYSSMKNPILKSQKN